MIIPERSPPLPWFDRALSGDEVRWVNDFVINETLTNLRGYSFFGFDDSGRGFRCRSLRLARRSITQPTTMWVARSSRCFRQLTAALDTPLTRKATVHCSFSPKKNLSFTPARPEWRMTRRYCQQSDSGGCRDDIVTDGGAGGCTPRAGKVGPRSNPGPYFLILKSEQC